MILTKYEQTSSIDEDTLEYPVTKEDVIWEARERLRLGNYEAASVWYQVAEKFEP